MRRFRLLIGQHIDNGPNGKERHFYADGRGHGNIIETSDNLLRLNGPAPMIPKFEQVMEYISVEAARAAGYDPAKAEAQSEAKVEGKTAPRPAPEHPQAKARG